MPKKPKPLKMPWVVQRPKEQKIGSRTNNDNSKIYNSTKWRKFRKVYFANNPLCVRCEKNGLITPGKDVDHITPIRLGGEIYDYDNLQTLCKPCHNRKSGKEAHMK